MDFTQLLAPPSDTEKQQALIAAIGKQRAAAQLGLLTGDRVLGGFGHAMLGDAQKQEETAQRDEAAGSAAGARALAMALAAQEKAKADKRAEETAAALAAERKVDNDRADRGQAIQGGMLALALKSMGLRNDEFSHKQEQDTKADADRAEAQARELSQRIGGSPTAITERLARIQGVLNKGGKDIPGIGPVDSRMPSMLQSDEAQGLQADARELVNVLLNLQSGAGVSNQERENKYRNYGIAAGSTEAQFRNGMAALRNDLAKELRAKQAGFRPEVVQTYKQRGGIIPEDITQAGLATPTNPSGTPDIPAAATTPSRTIVRNPKTGERRYLNADGTLGEAVK